MQTFLPFSDFEKSAESLDYRRLGKQRVECLQILKTLQKGIFTCKICKKAPIIEEMDYCPFCRVFQTICITPWYNHPAVKMWRNHESYLVIYGRIICKEWVNRGYKDTCYDKINAFYDKFKISVDRPVWLGNEKLHLSHMSNLIRKDAAFYRKAFGNEVPDNLEYVWPE